MMKVIYLALLSHSGFTGDDSVNTYLSLYMWGLLRKTCVNSARGKFRNRGMSFPGNGGDYQRRMQPCSMYVGPRGEVKSSILDTVPFPISEPRIVWEETKTLQNSEMKINIFRERARERLIRLRSFSRTFVENDRSEARKANMCHKFQNTFSLLIHSMGLTPFQRLGS